MFPILQHKLNKTNLLLLFLPIPQLPPSPKTFYQSPFPSKKLDASLEASKEENSRHPGVGHDVGRGVGHDVGHDVGRDVGYDVGKILNNDYWKQQ